MCPKVTDRYREEMRDKILRAAEKVFARKGYHAASMDDIVEESGLSKGALYGYFDSKEELFLAQHSRQVELRLDQLVGMMHASESATDKLTKVGELAIQQTAGLDRSTLQVAFEFWTAAPRIKAIRRMYEERYRRFHSPLSGLIREGMERGEFRKDLDAETLTSILIAAVDGLSLHWAAIGIVLDWDAVSRTLLGVVLDGIRVSPRRSPARTAAKS